MDKSTFERLIKTPNIISSNEANLLEELAEAFPYCQTAHLLLAKESKQKRSMNYPKKLRKASTYLLDRQILHRAIVSEVKETFMPTAFTEEIVAQKVLPSLTKLSFLDELEENLQKAKENRKKIEFILNKVEQKTKAIPTILVDDAIESSFFKTESRLGDEIHLPEREQESSNTVELFLAYLNQNPLLHENKKQENKNTFIQDEVIKRFLEKEPKITRQIPNTIVNENTNDLSKKSSELKNELVTENFAQILVKQNKIEKAKDIYQKLILKYPNKSAYFAAKLNELENK